LTSSALAKSPHAPARRFWTYFTYSTVSELGVEVLDRAEDLGGDLELALWADVFLDREGERLAELDSHLREAQPLPAADAGRAMDRDRDDGGAGFEGDTADSPFRFAELAAAERPPSA